MRHVAMFLAVVLAAVVVTSCGFDNNGELEADNNYVRIQTETIDGGDQMKVGGGYYFWERFNDAPSIVESISTSASMEIVRYRFDGVATLHMVVERGDEYQELLVRVYRWGDEDLVSPIQEHVLTPEHPVPLNRENAIVSTMSWEPPPD